MPRRPKSAGTATLPDKKRPAGGTPDRPADEKASSKAAAKSTKRGAEKRRGRPKGRTSEETRERILEAAEIEFAEKGFDGARTMEIARRAGLTHAMLHYYYKTKEALYATVLERAFGELSSMLAAGLRAMGEGAEAPSLNFVVQEGHRIFCEHPRFVRIVLWETAAGAPRLERIASEFYDQVVDLTLKSKELDGTGFDGSHVVVTMLGAVAMYVFEELLVVRLFGPDRFDSPKREERAEHLRLLVDAILTKRR